jgi:hypothetical protein
MHYPKNSSGRLRLLPRNEWRFEAEFKFSDGSKQWAGPGMLWPEAKQMAALDIYATEHKLKLPAT